jgi:hypothetical protein
MAQSYSDIGIRQAGDGQPVATADANTRNAADLVGIEHLIDIVAV